MNDHNDPDLFSDEGNIVKEDDDNIHELEISQDTDEDIEMSAEDILDEEILEIPAFLRRQSK